jgi:hypothetical protein
MTELQSSPYCDEKHGEPAPLRLSVVIIDPGVPGVLARCMDSLNQLASRDRVDVRVLKQRRGESTMQARARAATDLHCDSLVFLNVRYQVSEKWARAILDAHASGASVVGGCVVSPEQPKYGLDGRRSVYLWEYVHTAPPVPAGEVRPEQARLFPGGNTSYRAEVLNTYDIAQYPNEMEFHGALAGAGVKIHRIPDAAATFEPPVVTAYIVDIFRLARDFSSAKGGSAGDRTIQALIRAFLLPGWLFFKGLSRVWERPRYRSWLLTSIPWFALFSLVQTAGEIAGYIAPPNHANGTLD